jgi:hypothetical protein
VKDFLLKQNMQDLFHQSSVCIPSPRKAVCRMYLAYTKSCCGIYEPDSPDKTSSLEVNTRKVLRWAKLCETYDHSTPLDLMNELEMIRLAVQIARSSPVDLLESVLRLAVGEDLLLYVRDTPRRDVCAVPCILWTALFPGYEDGLSRLRRAYPENLAMISTLLDKGCDPNDGWTVDGTQHQSVWQMLMGDLYEPPAAKSDGTGAPLLPIRHHPKATDHTSPWVETSHIVAFLLIHGADPDAKFQYRRSGQNKWYHTDDFLMQVFENDRAKVDALRGDARKVRLAKTAQKRGLFAGFMGWSA